MIKSRTKNISWKDNAKYDKLLCVHKFLNLGMYKKLKVWVFFFLVIFLNEITLSHLNVTVHCQLERCLNLSWFILTVFVSFLYTFNYASWVGPESETRSWVNIYLILNTKNETGFEDETQFPAIYFNMLYKFPWNTSNNIPVCLKSTYWARWIA